jgi:hypothetical protein
MPRPTSAGRTHSPAATHSRACRRSPGRTSTSDPPRRSPPPVATNSERSPTRPAHSARHRSTQSGRRNDWTGRTRLTHEPSAEHAVARQRVGGHRVADRGARGGRPRSSTRRSWMPWTRGSEPNDAP